MQSTPLSAYARNVTSQFGEDGIVAEIFARIGPRSRICVEFGAWDGKHLSNTWDLWYNQGWRAILIEGDATRYQTLSDGLSTFPAVSAIHAYVTTEGANNLDRILSRAGAPAEIDLLSIDIDGDEFYIWEGLVEFQPRVVIIEYNPTIPPELDFVQVRGAYFGASAKALTRLAHLKGYGLVCCTETNCIFAKQDEFQGLNVSEPALAEVFPRGNLTYVVNAYDGATYLSRNPTYSPKVPLLTTTVLGDELKNAIRQASKSATDPALPAGALTPVRIFEIPERLARTSFWRRAAAFAMHRLERSAIPLRYRAIVHRFELRRTEQAVVREWVAAGRPVPPPHPIKRRVLVNYQKRHRLRVLIETGTYLGEMVEAMQRRFEKIYSIELSPELYARARERFSEAENVRIALGDSARVLPMILAELHEPALFWLDGHFSEGNTAKGDRETPILDELDAIFRNEVKGHVVLIDDARCFDGTGDYPTLAELERFVRARNPNASFEVRDDIIRVT